MHRVTTNWPFASLFSTLISMAAAGWKRSRGWKYGLLLVALFVGMNFGASSAWAQHEVTGEVTDAESGRTLPGANIVVQGTQIGTTTRSDGTFTLEAPSPTDSLMVSFVGYQRQTVPIDGRSEIVIALQSQVATMGEVVVNVGYQEQSVETTTGSYSQISGEDMEIDPATNMENVLKGDVPGVFGVNTGGRPGEEGANLLIRGTSTLNNNEPLVVIDGVPGRQGGLGNLNPNDIENVTVLKDASAAIYGSRAANGVILVQTKRGRAGETEISASVEQSYNQPAVVPEMADAATWMTMVNEVNEYRGNEPVYSQEEIEQHKNCPPDSWTCFNTDWYDAAIRDWPGAPQTKLNAAVTGGGEEMQYRVSLRGLMKDGVGVNSITEYNQIDLRSNLDGDLNDHLSLALNLYGRREGQHYPTAPLDQHWGALATLPPTQPARWPNGKPGPDVEDGNNPIVDQSGETGFDDRTTYFLQSNLSLTADIPSVDGWQVEGTVAYDHTFFNRKEFETPWTLYFWDGQTRDENGTPVLNPAEKGVPEPRLSQYEQNAYDLMLRGTTSYETTFGSHSTNFLLGTEYQASKNSQFQAFRRFFPTDQIPELFAGGSNQQDLTGTSSHSARLNFFGRVNYNYLEKYLFQVVARYDGSYIFPEGDRFGFFPSVSAGWRLAQEDWFNGLTNDLFSRLKLRASYGQVGNDQIEPYQFLRTFGFTGQQAYRDQVTSTISPTRVPNPEVSWEVATKFDVGFEGAILSDRLSFDAVYFREDRNDILWFRSAAVPDMAGFSLPRENIGRVNSWGLEGQLSYTQDITSSLSFNTAINGSWTENEVEFIDEAEGLLPYQRREGSPMHTSLYYITDGILNTQEEIENNPTWPGARPGDVKFVDVNGDGEINADDRKRIDENQMPDLIGSFDLGFTYDAAFGELRARANFQGAAQAKRYVFLRSGENGNYLQQYAEQRWTPENTDAQGPRAYNRRDPYWAQSGNLNTYFLRDARYLRLKTARIGYTMPSQWSQRSFGVGQATIYLSGRNLFTLTPLAVQDPELSETDLSEAQIELGNSYPVNRTITVGVQMNF